MNIAFRKIHPSDKKQIQHLHEQWFPVKYLDEFYDDLVYERMTSTGDPLFTSVGTMPGTVDYSGDKHDKHVLPNHASAPTSFGLEWKGIHSQLDQPPPEQQQQEEVIVACVVGCFLQATTLPGPLQQLLITNPVRHPRLFYIMTVGTTLRNRGIGTMLIEQCIQQVLHDTSCGVLYLHVLTTNVVAIQMYEQLGFHRVIEIPNYYTIKHVRHNCYLYAKFYHGNRGQIAASLSSSNIVPSSWYTTRNYCINLSGVWNEVMVKYIFPNTSCPAKNNERTLEDRI